METKWLEDFVSLAETRSFSRSAQLRRVTQPAFSRRIQALVWCCSKPRGRPDKLLCSQALTVSTIAGLSHPPDLIGSQA